MTGRKKRMIEKTNFENVPSNFASFGRYVLAPSVCGMQKNLPNGSGGEIQLTDAVNFLDCGMGVDGVRLNG